MDDSANAADESCSSTWNDDEPVWRSICPVLSKEVGEEKSLRMEDILVSHSCPTAGIRHRFWCCSSGLHKALPCRIAVTLQVGRNVRRGGASTFGICARPDLFVSKMQIAKWRNTLFACRAMPFQFPVRGRIYNLVCWRTREAPVSRGKIKIEIRLKVVSGTSRQQIEKSIGAYQRSLQYRQRQDVRNIRKY